MDTGKENTDREKGMQGMEIWLKGRQIAMQGRDMAMWKGTYRDGETDIRARIQERKNGKQERDIKIHESETGMWGMEKETR